MENEKHRQKLLLTNVKNAKNGQYMENVVKEIQERCTERGEESPYDVNQTRQKFRRCVQACRAVPSTLVPSQQQNQRYLHSLGHSSNRYGLSWQTLPNVYRQNNHVLFMDELNSDNIEYQ